MRIETVQSYNVTVGGNTGPARIASIPADTIPSASPGPAQTASPIAPRPDASSLIDRATFARQFPPVELPETVDVREFLSMTATLLKRMEQTRTYQQPESAPAEVDLAA